MFAPRCYTIVYIGYFTQPYAYSQSISPVYERHLLSMPSYCIYHAQKRQQEYSWIKVDEILIRPHILTIIL